MNWLITMQISKFICKPGPFLIQSPDKKCKIYCKQDLEIVFKDRVIFKMLKGLSVYPINNIYT